MGRPKQGLTINKVRTQTYKFSKFLGDVNAIKSGNILPRVTKRIVGKGTGRALKIFN